MKPRYSQMKNAPRRSTGFRRITKLFLFLLFIIVAFIFISILWKQPVIAPEQSQQMPATENELETVTEAPPPLTAEEIQLMAEEQERLEAEKKAEEIRLQLELEWLEKASFEAEYYPEHQSDIALESEWIIMPNLVAQGDVLLVRHHEENEVLFDEKMYKLQPFGTGYYTYIPIRRNIEPGQYSIGDQVLTIQAKDFQIQYLEVTEQLEGMRRDTERIAADQIKVNQARSQSEAAFLFPSDAEFLQPIEGRLTTAFGFTRYVNGNFSGSHMAIDLAAPEGTPIKATNEGIVVLSDELYLAGNSVYIDHGMGLFSQYGHLYELHVEVGDRVKQGEIIGLVGTTGFSTGPHLHFTFWAHNVPVNPDLFFGKTPFHWLP